MDLGITDRVAMVLGAGGGLGGSIATALANEGVRVAACDISEEGLQSTIAGAGDLSSSLTPMPFDLSDLAAMDAAVADVEARVGNVDIVVNITGGPPATPAVGIPVAEWRQHFDAMVTPVIHLTDRLLPHMRDAGWGRVITSTSSGVITPIPNLGLSNALRASLVGWSKTLAGEVAADGVTVNVVAPGRIATARIHQLNEARAQREGRSVEEVSEASTATIPVGRYGEPREYADVVTFLCSERASFVNGSVVRVDGGMIPSI